MSIITLKGGIDLHVHFREPGFSHKETIASGLNAANNSGIFTVFDMPNSNPVTDNTKHYFDKLQLSDNKYYHAIGGFTNSNVKNEQIVELVDHCKVLKVYLADSTGNLGISSKNLLKGLELIKDRQPLVMVHAENRDLIKPEVRLKDENKSRPPEAEYSSIEYVISLSDKFPNINFHVTHVSTLQGAEMLMKQNKVTWDVLPKHLHFNSSDLDTLGNFGRMNPPLREPSIQKELLELFFKGKIPILTSDHAPHTIEEKIKLVAGAPGVQELYLFVLDHFLKDNISKKMVEDMLFINPAHLLSKIRIATEEKMILVDTDQNFKLTRDKILSKCGWSLWENFEFTGKIIS